MYNIETSLSRERSVMAITFMKGLQREEQDAEAACTVGAGAGVGVGVGSPIRLPLPESTRGLKKIPKVVPNGKSILSSLSRL